MNTRRNFLKTAGILAAGTMLAAPKVHAAEDNTLRIAVIGCGGRGNGAVRQALNADANTVLWAVADAFKDKAEGSAKAIKADLENKDKGKQFNVPPERTFAGFDAYKKAIGTLRPGDVVLLTTPPPFRALHFTYAVEKNLNIFAEKPLAVDIPNLKLFRESNKKAAEKKLKVAIGLNNRHYFRTEETIKKIQDGGIGDITSLWVYRMHPTHQLHNLGNVSPLEFQLRHIFNFNWTSGGFIVDALIHNLDVCTWAIGQLPVAAQGQGGRLIRQAKDQMLDHAAVEYRFADGRRMMMFAQTMDNTYSTFQSLIHGTKGSAVVGEGVGDPKIFGDWNADRQRRDAVWTAAAPGNDSYQTEHDLFFKAIRDNQDWNEGERGIGATFTPILGRMAMETGQMVSAEQAWNSTFEYVPNLANLSFDGPFPLVPDAGGNYPQAVPGKTQV
ncbi:MAG: Gfo/Idh/MocA family oxidoreductase [Planctomycetaceae bacterium]|jgi:predicted dehydrogenase|nr:Gfo/Idh/MocA family oxidoreductase [Planctomycetaceae bacterium]